MIPCPLCQSETRTLRAVDDRRRRECVVCRHRFNTRELRDDELADLERARKAVADLVAAVKA